VILGQVIRKTFAVALALAAASVVCAQSAFALTLANVVDLRTSGSSGTENGALFYQGGTTVTGTMDPFLQLQSSPTDQGFNTDYRSGGLAPMNATSDPSLTHSLQLGSLQTVNQGGVDYYAFSLSVSDPTASQYQYVSLDRLQFYVADSGSISSLTDLSGTGTLQWDMDGIQNTTIYMDGGALSQNNGTDDLQILIPTSAFAGVDPSKYLYLYSQLGATSSMGTDTGTGVSQQWGALTTSTAPPAAPEPPTLWLLGAGLLGAAVAGRLKRRRRV
jgi:hypothetical protein